jgi:3-oxoacyl-[acyl-carrier-protein] synthase-3
VIYSKIIGTGGYLPEKIYDNSYLANKLGVTEDWIIQMTGIRTRHIAADDEPTSAVAEVAARQAIESAQINKSDIDLIIVATMTPDVLMPSTACILQERLGITGCPAFDIHAVCTGFIYALDIANKFIQSGSSKTALVVGADTLSRIVDYNDKDTAILLADGAGAVVLSASNDQGIISTHLHADGAYQDAICVPTGVGSGYNSELAYATMNGGRVFKKAVQTLGQVILDTLNYNKITVNDIDWLVPHQANLRIIEAIARRFNFPSEKVIVTVQDHANTSAATVPLALNTAVRDGRIKSGDLLLLEAFGSGFTWGSALVRY